MTMSQFSVGDRVRVSIDRESPLKVMDGKETTVVEVHENTSQPSYEVDLQSPYYPHQVLKSGNAVLRGENLSLVLSDK